ncbi:hypothetical protein NDI52_33795 [Leptolyngbya sp. PL-A3]|uniref:hypothetical protein n=1 Tax=Leptolyngbya sp. PL-A3 TaxID=2933911 RepID=UPI0032988519
MVYWFDESEGFFQASERAANPVFYRTYCSLAEVQERIRLALAECQLARAKKLRKLAKLLVCVLNLLSEPLLNKNTLSTERQKKSRGGWYKQMLASRVSVAMLD